MKPIVFALLIFVAGARAQQSKQPCQPTNEQICGANMQAVDAALASPSSLWAFVTSPQTGYFERIIAASRAGKLMPATWITKVIAARQELASASVGVLPNPQSAIYIPKWMQSKSPREIAGNRDSITVLGKRFIVPTKWIPYPMTDDALKHSPWPFQVEKALQVLYNSMITQGDLAQLDAVALAMPCNDYQTAHALLDIVRDVAWNGFMTDEVFGALLNVVQNPKTVDPSALTLLYSASRLSEAKAQAIAIEALKGKLDFRYDEVLFQMRSFPHVPYTLVLAASRLILSSDFRKRHPIRDQASAALEVQYAADKDRLGLPPAWVGDHYRSATDYQRVVDDFGVWFAQNQAAFEQKALTERDGIDKAYRDMSTSTVCKGAESSDSNAARVPQS